MKDTIIKETGNSRFLRSSVAEDITFAEFIALLRAGQLPIDLAGINEEGIDTLGMPLRKSTLLDDETETAIWGNLGDRKPTEALKTIFETLSATVSEKAKVVTGTYTGDKTVGRTISLGFKPKAVLVMTHNGLTYTGGTSFRYGGLALPGCNVSISDDDGYTEWSDTSTIIQIVDGGFKVNYSTDTYAGSNRSNTIYHYIAIA